MTAGEKKHFILKLLTSEQFKSSCPESSRLTHATNPVLILAEVNILCREMENAGDLKITSTKDHAQVGELIIIPTTASKDAYATRKYLRPKTINNIEKEVLQFLIEGNSLGQTRINHILVASSHSIFDTTQVLANLVNNRYIQMYPLPLTLRYNSENRLVNDHEEAFENLSTPIMANITIDGKSYFKMQYSDVPLISNFNFQENRGSVQIIQGDKNVLFQTNAGKVNIEKSSIAKFWTVISENKLISTLLAALIIFISTMVYNHFWG